MTTTAHPCTRRSPQHAAPTTPPDESLRRCPILIVDDDQSIRETLRMALEEEGYEVREAKDGAEALRALRRSARPLVTLLDLRLPRMSGVALLRRIHNKEHPLTRHAFLLLTANREALSPAGLRLLQRMRVSVIAKPFDLSDLLERVAWAAEGLADAEL